MATFALIKSADGGLDLDLFGSKVEAVQAARAWALSRYKDIDLPETDDEAELGEAFMDADIPLDFSVFELEPDREAFDAGFEAGHNAGGATEREQFSDNYNDQLKRAWQEFSGEGDGV